MLNYQKEFIDKISAAAIEDSKQSKILPSLTIAQAILESNWGRSGLTKASNNLFGIKGSFHGECVMYPTKEWDGTKYVNVNAIFKRYPSWAYSVADHSMLFKRLNRYHNLINEKDYREACRKVKADGYATSPTYTQSLINIIEKYHLDKYDTDDSVTTDKSIYVELATGRDLSRLVAMALSTSVKIGGSVVIGPMDSTRIAEWQGVCDELELKSKIK